MLNRPKPLVLLILDGFGYSLEQESNAIAMANTPCWEQLQKAYPMTLLDCSGRSVGLPYEQMGNSEIGPIDIGTGRYVPMLAILGISQPVEMTGKSLINAACCE